MAAPKENLLSLGHLTGMETNTFTKQRGYSLKKSVNRPVLTHTDFSTPQTHQHLKVMNLHQRWQRLKERELKAQQHNRQLLQQFDEAQETLREMLTLTATMKTIRMEYERYLEESSPRWQKQLKEKTQAAQKKRMEEYLESCLKNTEDGVTKPSAHRPLLSQGPTIKPQKNAATQKHYSQNTQLDYNQDGSPHLPFMQSSWLTHPQSHSVRFPIRAPYQPQGSSHVPPSFHPQQFQLHHLASTPSHHPSWPRQNPSGWASSQPDYPLSWTAGAAGIPSDPEALWGHLYMDEPPPERRDGAETSRAPSSKRERSGGSRSSHLSQELDIKPVRLSSGPAESNGSSRASSQASREKRKKREKRSQRTSTDRERRSSQESSRTSSAIVIAAATVAQSSESDASLEKSRTSTSRRRRRSAGLAIGSPEAEKVTKESTRSNGDDSESHKEDSQSTGGELGSPIDDFRSQKAGNQSPDNKSGSCREESGSQNDEESGSVSIKIETRGGDEIEKDESSSSELSSEGEKGEEKEECDKDLGDGDESDREEKEDSQGDKEQEERDVEDDDDDDDDDDDVSEIKNASHAEEEVETQAEEEDDQEEKSDGLKNEDSENKKQASASSQDEEVDEEESDGGEDKMELDEEEDGGGEEEQERVEEGEPEEDSDSEDSIISPQEKSKKMQIIHEEASEDEDDEEEEEGSKTGSSDDDSNEFTDEDIEHLLAPQERSQKNEEKDQRDDEKPKEISDKVEIFRVEMNKSTKMDHPSDSEEFDHFYD